MADLRHSRLAGQAFPFLALLAEVLVFHRHVLFRRFMIPWDLPGFHLPLATFAAAALGRGELPWWDPYTYCGSPFYANLQTQLFYPPAWGVFLLANAYGLKSVLRLLQWELVLHVWLAGAGAYLLARRMGATLWGALAGATVFQLGGYFASQAQHLGAICAAAWLPLAWLQGWRMAAEGATLRRAALLAAVIGMALLAGFPAAGLVVAGSTVLLAALLAAWRLGRGWTWAAAAASVLWGALLAAVLLIPGARLTAVSHAAGRGAAGDDLGGVPLVALRSLIEPGHNSIFNLDNYRLPWDPTFLYLYLGLPTLALIPAGLWAAGRRLGSLLAVLIAVCALSTMGGQTGPGHFLLKQTPAALKGPLYPEYFMASFVLAASLAAALGAGRLLAGRHPAAGALLVLVLAADLIRAGAGRPFNVSVLDYRSTSEAFEGSREVAAGLRTLLEKSVPPDRFDATGASVNWATAPRMLRLPTAHGDDPMALSRYLGVRRLFAKGNWWERRLEFEDFSSTVPDRAGIRYLVTRAAQPARVIHPDYRLVARLPGVDVFERVLAVPRFFLARSLVPARSAEEAVDLLRTAVGDPRDVVVEGYAASEPVAGGTVRVLRYESNSLALEVEAAGPAFLATAEVHYPGWVAEVDGQEVSLVMTNAAFRGLPVPPGRHRVEMRFRPADVRWGAALSLAAAMLCAWVVVLRARARLN